MAELLGDTSCSIHADRQGSARCPSCRQYFCRECITEHEGRLTCASCLEMESSPGIDERNGGTSIVWPMVQFLVAIAMSFLLFYLLAGTLGDIPDEFHDGTIWE